MKLARRAAKRETRRPASSRSARRGPASRRPKAHSAAKPAARPAPAVVLYRVCKSGWAVVTEKIPSAPHTRFVCPFCPRSHWVPGPVRGFRRVRRPQWLKLRRVFE